MAFERDYVTTFVICTGDSDFTPLVHKLRELDKRVIGVGIKELDLGPAPAGLRRVPVLRDARGGRRARAHRAGGGGRVDARAQKAPAAPSRRSRAERRAAGPRPRDVDELAVRVAQTVAGLQRSSGGAVLASAVKRALLRKDPTFTEAEYGFRAFGELLRHLADRNVIELSEGSAKGDPEVSLPSHGGETEAFELLRWRGRRPAGEGRRRRTCRV